jgi:hypothetical protein
VSDAQQLDLLLGADNAPKKGVREEANALLSIFYRLLIPLAPHVYAVDLKQRQAAVDAEQARQRQRDDQVQRQRERAQRIQHLRQQLEQQQPGISKKALERLIAQRLAE